VATLDEVTKLRRRSLIRCSLATSTLSGAGELDMELSAEHADRRAHLGCDVNIRALEARFEFVSAADGSGHQLPWVS